MLYYGSRISNNITKTPEGYLICMNVPINRTGTQDYLGSELMLDDDMDANERVSIVRDEKDVFDKATLASFEGKPVTNDHPDEDLDLSNNEMYQVGHCQNVRREGDFTVADLYITNPQMVNDIENGKREISCGYTCDFIPDGNGNYKQTNIRGNHIAVVNSGRAGEKVRIKDSQINDDINRLIKELNNSNTPIKEFNIITMMTPNQARQVYQNKNKITNLTNSGFTYLEQRMKGKEISFKDSSINDDDRNLDKLLSMIDNCKTIGNLLSANDEALKYKGRGWITKKEYDMFRKYQADKKYEIEHSAKDSNIEDSIYLKDKSNKQIIENELKSLKTNQEKKQLIINSWTTGLLTLKERDELIKSIKDSSIEDSKADEYKNRLRKPMKWTEAAIINKEARNDNSLTPKEKYEIDMFYNEMQNKKMYKSAFDSKGIKDFSSKQDLIKRKKELEDWLKKYSGDYTHFDNMEDYRQSIKETENEISQLENKIRGVKDMSYKQKVKDSLIPLKEKLIGSMVPFKQKIKDSLIKDANIKDESPLYNEFCKKLQNFHSWSYDFARVGDAIKIAYKNNELSKEEYDKLVKLYSEKDFSFSG